MDDLDRLFRHVVNTLGSQDPARLRAPFEIAELYQRIVPYRSAKLNLRFDSIEDYEMAILRLLAGERGYVTVQPADIQELLRAETDGVNPYPGAFREYAAATMTLDRKAVQQFLEQDTAYAPPEVRAAAMTELPPAEDAPSEAAPDEDRPPSSTASTDDATTHEGAREASASGDAGLVFQTVDRGPRCPHCDGELPLYRRAVFCPHCGRQLEERKCTRCGGHLEDGWKFCLSCGLPAQG